MGAGAGAMKFADYVQKAQEGETVTDRDIALLASMSNGSIEFLFERLGTYKILEGLGKAFEESAKKVGKDFRYGVSGRRIFEFFEILRKYRKFHRIKSR